MKNFQLVRAIIVTATLFAIGALLVVGFEWRFSETARG